MKCTEARQAMPGLIDGQLDHEAEYLVRQHLNECSECRNVYQAFEQDASALTQYAQRAPYPRVAHDVMEQIERSRSPWWDAFRAGSYRLASVAGLVLVILIVGAGAWALREMATTDTIGEGEPTQEMTLGTTDDEDAGDADELNDPGIPGLISEDDIDLIVDQLDEAGLVYDTDARSETNAYTVEFGRIAFDRHLTLLEYRLSEVDDDAQFMIGAFGGEAGGSRAFGDGRFPHEGWVALPAVRHDVDTVQLRDGETVDGNTQNSHDVAVDLSTIPDREDDRYLYQVSDSANGVSICCLTIEFGTAVSTITYEWDIEDQDEVVYVDESLEPVDSPPVLDSTVDPVWPEVTVNGDTIPVLDLSVSQAMDLDWGGIGVFGLPPEGELNFHYDHLLLPTEGDVPSPAIYQGSWTLQAQLEDPDEDDRPEVPSDVAEGEDDTKPAATPVPEDDDDDGERLRVLVYMVRGDEIGASSRMIPHTSEVATAAIRALLEGPDLEDEDVGLGTEIPAGTELLDISLQEDTLVVDLSEEFTEGGGSASILMRMAQVVHTGTQFDSIDDVQILIEGQRVETIGGEGAIIDSPMDRDDFEDLAPAILLETPAPHETVGNQIRLRGTSNTFEANLQIEIIDPMGNQVYRDFATASAGTGTRGEFDVMVEIDEPDGEGLGSIRMFEHSARDGERENVIVIPVRFEAN